MRCEDYRLLLDMFIDNALDESVKLRVEQHLLRCKTCAHEVFSIQQCCQMLRQMPPIGEARAQYRELTIARLEREFSCSLRSTVTKSNSTQWQLPLPNAIGDREDGLE